MSSILHELVQTGIYKRNQGRITRQITFAAVALIVALGLWRLSQQLVTWGPGLQWGLSGTLLAVGLWVSYRVVNLPQFADFLIAVEAEMNKVSWPTRAELFRASIVVLIAIFTMAIVLTVFDLVWRWVFVDLLRLF